MDEWQRLWTLFQAVAESGESAWQELVAAIDPHVHTFARRQPIGRLRDREDTPREIVTGVLTRLHKNDFAAIRKLCAQEEPPPLQAWLRLLVKRAAIDYMRQQPEFERGGKAGGPRWVSLATLSSRVPASDPNTLAEKRNLVIKFLHAAVKQATEAYEDSGDDSFGRLALEWKVPRLHVRRLAKKGEEMIAVLESVLAGNSYPETAKELGSSRRQVELTVRYIEEFLAARGFADELGEEADGQGD